MASIGVLGSLISQLGAREMPQYDPQAVALTQQRLQSGRLGNETALLQLADIKRQQAAEQEYLTAIQTNPALAQQLFGGGSVLGSLGPSTGGPPAPTGGAPMTQQTLLPGQPPGAPQVVPGGQDLSRFATPGGPPQSTIASLGPQPQGPQPAPQNPLLEMARRDPRAALLLQQRMQAQHLNQLTMQEKHLDIGVKVSEAVARQLQGVTDQASLDEARERIRLIHPQAAAQIPQVYSKEAVASLQQRGMSVVESAKTRLDDAKARRLDIETQYFPQMLEDTNAPLPGQAPAGGAGTTTTAGTRTITTPPAFEAAIADANRLYPQVSPTRIKSIIAAESNFDPKAVSSAGAQGAMQLMPGTAKDMGVDDPFDITQNVRGGTRYYAQLLTKYGGDERKALAAYNWGPANLDKVGGDVSKAPAETQAYVQKVLGGGGGGGTGAAQASAPDPRLAQLDAQIALRTRQAKQASLFGNESLSTRLNDEANRLTAEKKDLLDRLTEAPRAAARVTAEEQARYQQKQQQQAGPMLPEASTDLFIKLRTNIRAEPTFQTYQSVRNGFQNVRIGREENNAIGDLAIVNGIAKIFDPGSAVMRGEAQTVEEAQGMLQVIMNSPQRFFEGDRLTTTARQAILELAQKLARQKLSTAEKELRQAYEPFAKKGGFAFSQLLPLEEMPAAGTTAGGKPPAEMTIEELQAERARLRKGG